ncbi:MAG: 2-polyprenyl-3-methyl-6-methoxy-1,4-benzoquinone monooxygenase [Caldimonas sp.]
MLTLGDQLLVAADSALRVLGGNRNAGRSTPRPVSPGGELTPEERRLSGSLMRVNHVGEVCAQALYTAQGLATTNPELRDQYAAAAREEMDHLAWTHQRLDDLGSRPSWLNPLWYAGAFGLGFVAGKAGDAISLGFVLETERQVEQHLDGHLQRLPGKDHESRAVVEQMKADEAAHAAKAESVGATPLPLPIRWAMRMAGRVMTRTAHYI